MSGFREPVSDADRAEKARIVQNMLKTRQEIRQFFDDADRWNAAHPDEPLTVEEIDPDGELRRQAAWLDQQLAGEVQ